MKIPILLMLFPLLMPASVLAGTVLDPFPISVDPFPISVPG